MANLAKKTSQHGFTLIELVVVIILLAIISVYASSRFSGGSGYQLPTVQDQALSIIRQIQLGRMQSNVAELTDLSPYYVLRINSNCLGASSLCDSGESQASAVLMPESVSFSPSRLINFDLLGRPSTSPFEITLTDQSGSQAYICIEAEGFVHKGECF